MCVQNGDEGKKEMKKSVILLEEQKCNALRQMIPR